MDAYKREPEQNRYTQQLVVDFFRLHVRLFGNDWRALGWYSRHTQFKRFAVLCEIGELSQCRILDVGCGLGDLYGYLRGEGIKIDYTGYDLLPEMVERAQRRYPEARFLVRDVLQEWDEEPFDYILSSGAFNIDFGSNASAIQQLLRIMIQHSRRGVAINFLSTKDTAQDPIFYHYDPQVWLNYSRTLCSRVELREDYLPNDFTLYLYR